VRIVLAIVGPWEHGRPGRHRSGFTCEGQACMNFRSRRLGPAGTGHSMPRMRKECPNAMVSQIGRFLRGHAAMLVEIDSVVSHWWHPHPGTP